MENRPIIEVKDLRKSYVVSKRISGLRGALIGIFKRQTEIINALRGINFVINAGEIVGFMGPNGAGKSTTVKILSGIMLPTQGEAEVLGLVPWKNRREYVKNIGVVFGQRTQLWWDLPIEESFNALAHIYGINKDAYKKNLKRLTSLLDIERFLHTPARQLSLGQRMRCDIAASLLHEPPLVFLDEPTIGLDAVVKEALRNFILAQNKEKGTTILLTSHDLDDMEILARRIMIIGRGEILFDGNLQMLRARLNPEKILTAECLSCVEGFSHPQARLLECAGSRIKLGFHPEVLRSSDLLALLESAYGIKDFVMENVAIEEVVAGFYRNEVGL